MEMSRTAVGVLAGLCLAGGAAGAFFVSRAGAPVQADEPRAALEQSVAPAVVEPAPSAAFVPSREAEPAVVRRAPARTETRRTRPVSTIAEQSSSARVTSAAPPVIEEATSTPTPFSEPTRPADPEPVAVAEPAAPQFEELVVSAGSVLGLQVETAVTSETARLEDEVVARVTRDIRVGDRVAIPAGSKAYGQVTFVGRGGRIRDRARLGVRFNSLVLGDGTRVPIDTDAIFREGDSPTGESAAKIGGGAIGGAIIGGILGGGKGAAIGGSVGAGAGTAAVMAGGRNAATLPAGATLTIRLLEPASVTVDR